MFMLCNVGLRERRQGNPANSCWRRERVFVLHSP